jgi:fatty acid desaturase
VSFTTAIVKDIRRVRKALRQRNLDSALKALERTSLSRLSFTIAMDWLVIFAAWYSVAFVSLWLLPVSIIIVGNRQRALGNLLHDFSHWNPVMFGRSARLVADLLTAMPLFEFLDIYKSLHQPLHHDHLGMADDPDFIHSDAVRGQSWFRVLLSKLFSRTMWSGNCFGYFPRISWWQVTKLTLWWLGLMGLLYVVAGIEGAALFLLVWFVAKATVFHLITTFREISDHVGLVPGTLIGFTRNHAMKGLAGLFWHPHYNGAHLAHHIDPGIPYYNIKRANELFMACEEYRNGHHCDGYFFGDHPAVDCWTGKCLSRHNAKLPKEGRVVSVVRQE